jgi:hypothetical protein
MCAQRLKVAQFLSVTGPVLMLLGVLGHLFPLNQSRCACIGRLLMRCSEDIRTALFRGPIPPLR